MNRTVKIAMTLIAVSPGFVLKTRAEESTLEKAVTGKSKTVEGVKSTARKMDDGICETVN